ncbi:MAG TPA: hypothetical protein VEW69_07400 [Alphaproteobacteria bacterium]|nr:hypothetical protein [Alphaproteobacteria bacterium]
MLRTMEQFGQTQAQEDQAFWRPLIASSSSAVAEAQPTEKLWRAEKEPEEHEAAPAKAASARLQLTVLRETLGQTWGSMIALFLGSGCLIAAVVTSFLFTPNTLLEWQAIQLWRIEWLLAAIALFAAGTLLKKK